MGLNIIQWDLLVTVSDLIFKILFNNVQHGPQFIQWNLLVAVSDLIFKIIFINVHHEPQLYIMGFTCCC